MGNRLITLLLITIAGYAGAAHAGRIAVIGTGDVAAALGPRFAENGHDVIYGSRRPESESAKALVQRTGRAARAALPADAAADADIIVMAVPAEVAVDVLIGLGDTAGKIVIDPSNAFEFTGDNLAYTTIDSSMGELLQ
ncbi:MAG: NAD(P)-binding domain-containing protein, partial [Pseudomonadota bacterium]